MFDILMRLPCKFIDTYEFFFDFFENDCKDLPGLEDPAGHKTRNPNFFNLF